MAKVEEYLQQAAQCREMAQTATPVHRQQLEQMAATWEELARIHQQQLETFSRKMGLPAEGPLPADDDQSERKPDDPKP